MIKNLMSLSGGMFGKG